MVQNKAYFVWTLEAVIFLNIYKYDDAGSAGKQYLSDDSPSFWAPTSLLMETALMRSKDV